MTSSNTGARDAGSGTKGANKMFNLFKTTGLTILVGATAIAALVTGVFADESGPHLETASLLREDDRTASVKADLEQAHLDDLHILREVCNSPEFDLIAFLCAPNGQDDGGTRAGPGGSSAGAGPGRDPGAIVAVRICGDGPSSGRPTIPMEERAAEGTRTKRTSNEFGRAELTTTFESGEVKGIRLTINRSDGSSTVLIIDYGDDTPEGEPTVSRVSFGETDRRGRYVGEYEYDNVEGGPASEALGPIDEELERIAREIADKYPELEDRGEGDAEDAPEMREDTDDPPVDPFGPPGDSNDFCDLREDVEQGRIEARCMLDPNCEDPAVKTSTDTDCDDPVEDKTGATPGEMIDCSEEPEDGPSCEAAQAARTPMPNCDNTEIDPICPADTVNCLDGVGGTDSGVSFTDTLEVPLCDEALCDPTLTDGLADDLLTEELVDSLAAP